MRCDLHTHSSVSDGTDTPTRLVNEVVRAGLDMIALCDHDTFDGLPEAREAAAHAGVGFLPGLEMSTRKDGTSVHLLGYGCDPTHAPLVAELERIRDSRVGRLQAMAEKLTALGMPLTVDDILAQAKGDSVGRPHVADALVAKGYVADRREAFDRFIFDGGPGYVGRYATPLAEAIDLIHDAHGVAVIAHPWGRESRAVLPVEYLITLIAEHGLDGLEVDHTDHDEPTRAELRAFCEEHGLLATGSSDYHGAGKPDNPLGINTTGGDMVARLLGRIAARGGSSS